MNFQLLPTLLHPTLLQYAFPTKIKENFEFNKIVTQEVTSPFYIMMKGK